MLLLLENYILVGYAVVVYFCHNFLKLNRTFILMGCRDGLSVLLSVSVCIDGSFFSN